MSKYLKTKDGSLESAVLEAVSSAQQAAIAIAKKEKEEESVQEKYTAKQYKMAFGVLNDPRWKGGNMTKIVDTIEKIAKGLSKDKAVYAAIKLTNEGKDISEIEKSVEEELTAKQKKIDMNKDGKITGDDLAKLRAKGAKKEEVQEEVELDEASNPFELYQTVKGWEKASKEMVKELEKAKKMSDKNKARDHMYKVQKKFSKYGAQDTEANTEIRHALGMNEEQTLAQRAAQHIADMWKESAGKKVDKKEEKDDNEEGSGGQTMTGKPMSKVEVSPADKEK